MNEEELAKEGFRFTLADFNSDLVKEWAKTPFDFHEGNIFNLTADVVLIPGNSFGLMQDGVEQIALYHFGKDIERAIQNQIKTEDRHAPWKELLIGKSVHVDTNKESIPALIYAPIYRVPQIIANPMDVYLAFRDAIDHAIERGYKNIIFPGFGTQTGKLKEDWAVRLMNYAIEDAVNKKEFPKNLQMAELWHFQAYPKQ